MMVREKGYKRDVSVKELSCVKSVADRYSLWPPAQHREIGESFESVRCSRLINCKVIGRSIIISCLLSLSRFMAFVTLSRVLTRKVFNAPSMPNKTFLGSAAAAESKRTKWRGNNIINYTRSRCNSRSCHQIILSLKIHRLLYSPPPSSCSATFETNYPNKTPRHERERRISADVETVTRRNFMSQVLMCTRKLHSRAHS